MRPKSANSCNVSFGALIVEAGENVVSDERQRLARAPFQQRQTKAEEQLIARALAQMFEANPRAIRARSDEDRPVGVVVIHRKARKAFAGRDAEQRAGAGNQGILHGGAVTLDRARCEL